MQLCQNSSSPESLSGLLGRRQHQAGERGVQKMGPEHLQTLLPPESQLEQAQARAEPTLTKPKSFDWGPSEQQARDALQLRVTNHFSFNAMERFALTEIAEKNKTQKFMGSSICDRRALSLISSRYQQI